MNKGQRTVAQIVLWCRAAGRKARRRGWRSPAEQQHRLFLKKNHANSPEKLYFVGWENGEKQENADRKRNL
jgi:hypothetical protein